jgi:hypothetical protein
MTLFFVEYEYSSSSYDLNNLINKKREDEE